MTGKAFLMPPLGLSPGGMRMMADMQTEMINTPHPARTLTLRREGEGTIKKTTHTNRGKTAIRGPGMNPLTPSVKSQKIL